MSRAAFSITLALLVSLATARGIAAPVPATAPGPRLVVILVVDQMRADYVERFGHQWTGGFRRLMDEGAWFRLAAYPYLTTVTCVGHSTIVTGSFPNTHGIVANNWWDRGDGKPVNCVSDPTKTLVSYGEPAKGGTSTRNLLVPTLGDELRMQSAVPPRIVTLSLKDYTATTMAGRTADAVIWFNLGAKSFMTSSAFTPKPVPFVAEFLKAHPMEGDFGKAWTKLLPESDYLYPDDGASEVAPGGWTTRFPHQLAGLGTGKPDSAFYVQWDESPYSDAFLGRFAEAAIDHYKLGQGAGTDYLAISFSALDLVGHGFGPRSQEVQDVLAHLDRTLGSLMARLDASVGRQQYVLALAADHGVAPIPEQGAAAGIDAGRVKSADISGRVDEALAPLLGPGKYIARISYNDLYFEKGVYEKLRENPAAMRAALEAVGNTPGIARVFRGDELQKGAATADRLMRAAQLSYYPGRSGDFVIVPRPYFMLASSGTTHGNSYGYDQRVPLFLFGRGIRAGQFLSAASPADIAPTLGFLCGVTLASSDGRVLTEALTDQPPRRPARPAAPAKR